MRSSGVVEGPEEVAKVKASYTGQYLALMLRLVKERVSEATE
ncbi:hypothetical protein [Erythrobacter sp. 3-20A1M]|nr:hypothetical protein [Erythrobacter sp. 3-20A1M]|tara:strand:- start:385 stop:510 length:126 start_codon:yes stop_codon:yes gene_type:complete